MDRKKEAGRARLSDITSDNKVADGVQELRKAWKQSRNGCVGVNRMEIKLKNIFNVASRVVKQVGSCDLKIMRNLAMSWAVMVPSEASKS